MFRCIKALMQNVPDCCENNVTNLNAPRKIFLHVKYNVFDICDEMRFRRIILSVFVLNSPVASGTGFDSLTIFGFLSPVSQYV